MRDTNLDHPAALAALQRIELLPSLLQVIGNLSGMGFVVVASVTERSWIACAVHDRIGFGIEPGQQLDVGTTFCRDVRHSRQAIIIERASTDARYHDHLTPRIYGFESYISVPVIAPDGSYFGTLCAIDRRPMPLNQPYIESLFQVAARLIGTLLPVDGGSPGCPPSSGAHDALRMAWTGLQTRQRQNRPTRSRNAAS